MKHSLSDYLNKRNPRTGMFYRLDEIPAGLLPELKRAQEENLRLVEGKKNGGIEVARLNGVDPIFADRIGGDRKDFIDIFPNGGPPGNGGGGGIDWGRLGREALDWWKKWGKKGLPPPWPPDIPGLPEEFPPGEREPSIFTRSFGRPRRRMNPCNAKALRRSLRRLCAFQRMVDRTWIVTSSVRRRPRGGACAPPARKRICK